MALESQADFAGAGAIMDRRKAKLDSTTRDRGQNFLDSTQITALSSRASAEAYLKALQPAYFTDGRLNYMTWNDLKFAVIGDGTFTKPYV